MRAIEQRLTRLEQAAAPPETLMIVIHLVPAERTSSATAAIGSRVWNREPDELEEAFVARVGAEARLARPGNEVLVAFLD